MMPYTVAGDVHRRGGCVEPRSRDVAEKTRGASSVSLVVGFLNMVSEQTVF
jgi:hypothetical protein